MEIKITSQTKKIVFSLLVSLLAILPLVLAYPTSYPAYDLYTVFVEAIFGGFWLSVLGLTIIMYILMGPLGGISQFTTIYYCAFFVYAMALGYTNPIILVGMWTLLVGWFVFQIFKYINSGSVA